MRLTRLAIFLALSFASVASAQDAEARRDATAPTQYELDNGLRVILQPLPGRRFVAVAVSYDVGSRDVPRGWTGLAHLSEHLMFSGTDEIDELGLYQRLDAAGSIDHNAVTTADRTYYYEVLPASQLGWGFWLEAQRMARTVAGLTPERVDRQRAIVLHEGWERDLYGWRGLVQEALYSHVFPIDHPYQNVREREADVNAIGLPHVQWFLQTHYAPDTATIAVVGGFDPAEVRAQIERYFGPIRRSGPAADRTSPPVTPLEGEHTVELELQTERDRVYLAWPTPPLYAEGDAALDVLSTLLLERRDAPLRQALIESGLALDASATQLSAQLGSRFVIEAVPRPGRSPAELVTVIDRVMSQLGPFDEALVDEARERWVQRARSDAEDLSTRAVFLTGGTPTYLPTLENEQRRYGAVEPEDVARVAADWLPAPRRLVLIGHANPNAPPEGRVLRVDTPRPR